MIKKPQYNTNTATHEDGLFTRFDINPETKEMKYLEDIEKDEEQILFAKLCSKRRINNKCSYK